MYKNKLFKIVCKCLNNQYKTYRWSFLPVQYLKPNHYYFSSSSKSTHYKSLLNYYVIQTSSYANYTKEKINFSKNINQILEFSFKAIDIRINYRL